MSLLREQKYKRNDKMMLTNKAIYIYIYSKSEDEPPLDSRTPLHCSEL